MFGGKAYLLLFNLAHLITLLLLNSTADVHYLVFFCNSLVVSFLASWVYTKASVLYIVNVL